jgi:hypothetical protein
MFMEWLWITPAPNLSTYGVRIWPLARMERGFMRKSGAGDAGVVFLRLKSLGVDGLDSMIPRDLDGCL